MNCHSERRLCEVKNLLLWFWFLCTQDIQPQTLRLRRASAQGDKAQVLVVISSLA